MDNETSINELKDKIKKFCEDRDWDQYHNAKELAIGIVTESSELLQHFRFKSLFLKLMMDVDHGNFNDIGS